MRVLGIPPPRGPAIEPGTEAGRAKVRQRDARSSSGERTRTPAPRGPKPGGLPVTPPRIECLASSLGAASRPVGCTNICSCRSPSATAVHRGPAELDDRRLAGSRDAWAEALRSARATSDRAAANWQNAEAVRRRSWADLDATHSRSGRRRGTTTLASRRARRPQQRRLAPRSLVRRTRRLTHAAHLKRAPLRRRPQGAPVRALRPGRDLATAAGWPDPRSHQRRPRRQPAREPADRLPELRGDARDALRAQEPARARAARRAWRAGSAFFAEVRRASATARAPCGSAAPVASRRQARRRASPQARKVERPPYEHAAAPRSSAIGYLGRSAASTASPTTRSASGSASTSASERSGGTRPAAIEIPTRTWPDQRREEAA